MQKASALVYERGHHDFRIRWFLQKPEEPGANESGFQYVTRERATFVAITCYPEKVEQDYAGPRTF